MANDVNHAAVRAALEVDFLGVWGLILALLPLLTTTLAGELADTPSAATTTKSSGPQRWTRTDQPALWSNPVSDRGESRCAASEAD